MKEDEFMHKFVQHNDHHGYSMLQNLYKVSDCTNDRLKKVSERLMIFQAFFSPPLIWKIEKEETNFANMEQS